MTGILTDEQIDLVLTEKVVGRIGCSDGNKLYVVPVSYAYDGRAILAHSLEGMKINMMRQNPDVCFEVDDIKSFTHWQSVIAWGRYQELTDERDRYHAMKLFVEKMLHIKTSQTAVIPPSNPQNIHGHSQVNARPVIYRIIITKKTGRFESE